MSGNPIFVCNECGARCDHDEVTNEDLCFECEKIDIESEGFDADWIC